MSESVKYDEAKFAELMIYVADRMAGDSGFGATMLNKVLFFSDFFHYAETGKPITGAEYQRLQHGPAPRRVLPVQSALIHAGDAAVRHVQVGNFTQKRLVPLREADLSAFSGAEIATVEDVIAQVSGRTALQVSDASHRMVGWKVASTGSTIPYESVFLYDGPVTDDDVQLAEQVAKNLSEELATAGVA